MRRVENKALDLRFGKREYKSKPNTWNVDAFLQIMYENVAKTLPDE